MASLGLYPESIFQRQGETIPQMLYCSPTQEPSTPELDMNAVMANVVRIRTSPQPSFRFAQ